MIDALTTDLSSIDEETIDRFIKEFIHEHGFDGVHTPVFRQWFHIGNMTVSPEDELRDPRTFGKLALIIQKVYAAGGCTHLWLWGDNSRSQTAKSTRGGTMGAQEKLVLDMIADRLGPLKGWTMSYGFDLWEWVTEQELQAWHAYLNSKPG